MEDDKTGVLSFFSSNASSCDGTDRSASGAEIFSESKARCERARERTSVRDRASDRSNAAIGKKIEPETVWGYMVK